MRRRMAEIEEYKRDDTLDYLFALKALNEIPFPVGKNLLIDFLAGDFKNPSIKKNDLDEFHNFDVLKSKEIAKEIIDNLINNGLIEITSPLSNKFSKILSITQKGQEELMSPQLFKKKLKNNFVTQETQISDKEREIFKELDFFLNKFNDSQKKAIVSQKNKLLCIAGAGSGKTTVLTKRIEFLVKFCGVPADKILAITFTRKARQEMAERLSRLNIFPRIETFNSFCEQILRNNASKIYTRSVRVISYQDKIMALMEALNASGLEINNAVDKYFSDRKKEEDNREDIFLNDCYFILDYFKYKNKNLYDFSEEAQGKDKETARMIFKICSHLKQFMEIQGLRDFTDQMIDTISFFKKNPNNIPKFDHILVDEYQDVNSSQIELLDLLNSKNLFAVGDPRQSIYGWRGSDIKYVLNFHEKFPESETIYLNKNYRSNKSIVNFINSSIRSLGLPDLESSKEINSEIKLLNFPSESDEFDFVIKKILESNVNREEIFVLARTNRQLSEISGLLKKASVRHILKTDEVNRSVSASPGEVTLATIHSIKGLEAKIVFVIGCNEQNFPCKASDHPIIEIIKVEEYDKEEEEKRLFYVAISRAKEKLFLSYTGKKPTYFITDEMKKMISSSSLNSYSSSNEGI